MISRIRTGKGQYKLVIPEEELRFRYLGLQQSTPDIAKAFGCSKPTILEQLKEYQIFIRSGKQAHNTPIYVAKLKQLLRGNKNCLGRHHTEEEKVKMSLVQKGKVFTEEHRANISLAGKGRIVSEATRAKHRLCNLKRYKNIEERVKTGLASHKYHEEHSEFSKQQTERLRAWRENPEIVKRWLEKNKEARQDSIHRAQQSIRSRAMWRNPDIRAKLVAERKKRWRANDYEVMHKMMAGMNISPSKPETTVLNILNTLAPRDWKFVGDGQVIIGGLNPDFININGRKLIIEVFGNYWHTQKLKPYKINEGRINVYATYGYRTLIVWEKETKDPDTLQKTILEFIKT